MKNLILISGYLIISVLNPFAANSQVKDIDGNVYNTVEIGWQTWMVENLRTTKYNDSTIIPLVSDTTWYTLTTDAYCWYENDISNKNTYGALYNWYAIINDKLCPTGWRIPTDSDWKSLSNYFGGDTIAGGKLKEIGIAHWNDPNTYASNESGFTGLPGGGRWPAGWFDYINERGYWWSTSKWNDFSDSTVWLLEYKDNSFIRIPSRKESGFSVRCIKYFKDISVKKIK